MILYKKEYFFYAASFVSVCFNFLSLYLISKLYLPGQYGEYLYVTAIVTIFSTLSTLKVELSITDAVSIENALGEAFLTFIVSLVMLSLILPVALWFEFVDLNFYVTIFPICIVLYVIVQQVFIFLGYHLLNGILVSSISIINFVCILCFQHKTGSLFSANLISYAIPLIISIVYVIRKFWFFLRFDFKILYSSLSHKSKYIYSAYPLGILAILSQSANIFLINITFGLKAVGTFGLLNKIFSMPSSSFGLVSAGLARYKFSRLNKSDNRSNNIIDFFRTTVYSSLLAFPILIILIYFITTSTNLFMRYSGVIDISLCFVVASAVQFVINQICVVFLAVNLVKMYVKIMISQLLLLFVPFIFIGIYEYSFNVFLLIQSGFYLILFFFLKHYLYRSKF